MLYVKVFEAKQFLGLLLGAHSKKPYIYIHNLPSLEIMKTRMKVKFYIQPKKCSNEIFRVIVDTKNYQKHILILTVIFLIVSQTKCI